MKATTSLLSWWVIAVCILLSAFAHEGWRAKNTVHAFTYDSMGYYIYLPALFIYKDIKHFEFLDAIITKYEIWGNAYRPGSLPNGNVLDKYAVGQALFESPWFFVAHFLAPYLGYPADGFSSIYPTLVSLGNILVGILALWYLRRILLRYFPDAAVAISLFLLLAATNYWCYIGYNAHMTHASLFALYVFLLWHTISWHEQPSWKSSLAIGATIGFATLMRPTDVVCVFVPLLWGLSRHTWREQLALFFRHLPKLAAAAAVAACFITLQLAYWKIATGSWIYYSYGDEYLEPLKAHIAAVLYSYKKGWLTYTPIMLLALCGFVPLYKQYRPSFWAILAFFLVNFYLVASWSTWWYGGSFGQRALVQSYAFLLFPFAAFWTWALQSRLWVRGLLVAWTVLCIWLNITQTFSNILDADGSTKTYFWHVFGKTSVTLDDKKYLQIDEKFTGSDYQKELLYSNHFMQGDSLFQQSGMLVANPMGNNDTLCAANPTAELCTPVLAIDTLHRHSPEIVIPLSEEQRRGWLRVSLQAGYVSKEWNFWNQHVLWITFWQQDTEVKVTQLRPASIIDLWKWTPITFDTEIPKDKNVDRLKIHVGSGSTTHALYLDDFKVERLY